MMGMKSVLAALGVSVAMAAHPLPYAPAPYHPAPAPAPYHPAPAYHPVEKIPPKPFAYEYGVHDEYSGANFGKNEVQDEYGVVSGEYRQDTLINPYTLDTFAKGDPDIGAHLSETFMPSIICPI